jgi:hypothetical protein
VTTGDSNTGPLLLATRSVPIVFVLVPAMSVIGYLNGASAGQFTHLLSARLG